MKKCSLFLLALALSWSLIGCSTGSPEHTESLQNTEAATEEALTASLPSQADTIHFHDKILNIADLSPSTAQWLTWYNTLSEEEQLAVSYVPSDLYELCGYPAAEEAVAEETQPGADHYEAYRWMVGLKAEDVDYVEFLNFSDPQFPYRRYEGDEIQEVIDLFQAKACLEYMPFHPVYEYEPVVQWPGYYTTEFHVVMKDGTAHTIGSVYSVATVIDGTGFGTVSAWLNHHWPESGNAPLPENWTQEVASRNYHIADCVSTLSTASHDAQRENLDYSYDTEIDFGSLSRHYPIGRGGIELSASGASPSGVSISAHWASTGLPTQLQVQSQYWLEKWQDDIGCYVSFDGGQFRAEVPQLLPETTCSWYISWKNTCGILEPGHYRVGMIFCEEYNGNIQNETTCYAKFSITETN